MSSQKVSYPGDSVPVIIFHEKTSGKSPNDWHRTNITIISARYGTGLVALRGGVIFWNVDTLPQR